MLDAHASAILDLLRADPHLTVYDGGTVPDLTEPPYVVVYLSIDAESMSRLCMSSDRTQVRLTTHSVGANGQAARIVASRVRAALLDVKLAVDGWTSYPIRRDYGQPPDRDESTGRVAMDAIDVWTYTTSQA